MTVSLSTCVCGESGVDSAQSKTGGTVHSVSRVDIPMKGEGRRGEKQENESRRRERARKEEVMNDRIRRVHENMRG